MNTTKLKITALLVIILTIGFSFTTANKITIKGSWRMHALSKKWAEVYMKKNPGVSIEVIGGGSGEGLDALINGSIDIANASRPIQSAEVEKIQGRYRTLGVEIPCAKDYLAVYLSKDNPVTELTLKQIKEIYSGKITNWKHVGGPNAPIKLYGRETSSGTFAFFKDKVVKTDITSTCQVLPGTAAIVNAVQKDKYAVGYGGATTAEGIKNCAIKKNNESPGILPNEATIKDHSYPITRYLYMYLKSKPTGEAEKFIDWTLSPDGQKLIAGAGYFSLK